jgi:hypothetical protein
MGIGLGIGINRSNYAQGIFGAYQSRVIADGGVTEAGGCVDAVSSLLQSASLLLIPSGYKGGKAYAQIPTNGNGDLTWTRASDANRTNSSGNIELMASGVPRLSYMHGSCPALLLEPQRTNLALQSESFDNASWVKSNSTVTANSTTSPDGTTNADTLITTNSLNFHRLSQNTTISALTNYTYTIFAKQNSSSLIQIALNTGFTSTPSLSPYANFNLSTGVVSQSGNGATASIQSVGNGWYRCVITATSLIGISAGQINIVQINSTTAPPFQSWQGTGEESVFIYGSQVEAGAYPTTYIPTTTASATRVADSFSRNNIFTNGLITSSGGTWFVEFRNNVAYTRDTFTTGIYISDTTNLTSNNINIRNGGGGAVRLAINKVISGVSTALYLTTTDTVKLAIKWNGTTADIFANGTKVISATSFTPTNMEFLRGEQGVPAFIQQMALYPTPLSDTDCTTITTL